MDVIKRDLTMERDTGNLLWIDSAALFLLSFILIQYPSILSAISQTEHDRILIFGSSSLVLFKPPMMQATGHAVSGWLIRRMLSFLS